MTALGPAGLAILVFVGAITALAAAYSIERAVRRALGLGALAERALSIPV